MSVIELVMDVIEKSREIALERGCDTLLQTVDRAEVVSMIEMWDADLNLETQTSDTAFRALLAKTDFPMQ